MKLTLSTIAALLLATPALAVDTTTAKTLIGAEGELALPLGTYADATGFGFGASLTGEYRMMPNLGLTGRIGYQFHLEKTAGSASARINALPILVGARYYVQADPKMSLFLQPEIGLFVLMASVSAGGFSSSETEAKFGFGARAGYQMNALSLFLGFHFHNVGEIGDSMKLTAGAGYQFAGL